MRMRVEHGRGVMFARLPRHEKPAHILVVRFRQISRSIAVAAPLWCPKSEDVSELWLETRAQERLHFRVDDIGRPALVDPVSDRITDFDA